jgi:hypothetical protein
MTDMSAVEMWRILSEMAIGRAERRLAVAKIIDFYTPLEFSKEGTLGSRRTARKANSVLLTSKETGVNPGPRASVCRYSSFQPVRDFSSAMIAFNLSSLRS